tara:strand:+ start:235 stop:1197 length:963 start_codon:yes stop_codon:yes gene_type:complete
MKYQRLIFAFAAITAIGILYDKYKEKYEPNEVTTNFNLIERHLLKSEKNGKPNLWVHTDYNVNARNWLSFYSRNTTDLNQPYVNMCIETIVKWCGNSFNICLINDDSFEKLLDNWTIELDNVPEPLRRRTRVLGIFRLMHKYGGVLLPNSFLMMRDFKPIHDEYLGNKDAYTAEVATSNDSSDVTRLFPTHKIVGCKKDSKVVRDLCNYLEVNLSTDSTAESDFKGNIDRMLFKHVNNGAMNIIPANLIGVKDVHDEVILLDDLMGETKVDFDNNMIGVYIPKCQLMKRRNYHWFVRMSKRQIVSSNVILGRLFKLSYTN